MSRAGDEFVAQVMRRIIGIRHARTRVDDVLKIGLYRQPWYDLRLVPGFDELFSPPRGHARIPVQSRGTAAHCKSARCFGTYRRANHQI
jgi:hypothetical protein